MGAVVALGGYGRGQLAPRSDIDLMVLHAERDTDRVRVSADALFYPLWDGGFDVGHAVRTVDECRALAEDRVDGATALLDARLIAGDETLVERMRERILGDLRRDPDRFLDRLGEDRRVRRERFGSASQTLEPDVKSSAGGLRDLQVVGWVAAVVAGGSADVLVGRGSLAPSDVGRLDDAEEFLVRVRSALHLESGRRTDRVLLELQPDLARMFGFDATAGLAAPDVLMRALFEHARAVDHVVTQLLGRARSSAPPARAPAASPADLLEGLARAAGTGDELPPAQVEQLLDGELARDSGPLRWNERMRRAFVAILGAGPSGTAALQALDHARILERLVPAWSAVRCRPQRDPYHRSPVDVHLLRTAAAAAELLARPPEDAVAARAAASVADRDALLLGALLHDIGKTGEGDHVEAGERIAGETLAWMGFGGATAQRVRFLVREHLLLADTATRRDLADEDLVLDVAAAIGDAENLALLYLLTVADATSTGPLAWTPWRRALVRDLVARVQRVLDRGEMDQAVASDLAARAAALAELLGADAGSFVRRVPRAYLLAVEPASAARHASLLSPPPGSTEVRTFAERGERPGTYDLTVVAADRRGLLASIAGALALHGIGILSARAFTTDDGTALDLFAVEGMFDPDIDEERWRRFRGDLRRALEGRASLDHRVREKRRHYRAADPSIPVEVRIDTAASDVATVIEVSAADRIGLLFDLASTFRDLDLDVHVAKVATFGPRVIDAFYVRDDLGEKVTDPRVLEDIEAAIRARLGG